jgi:uncharacterized protein YdhG (YjbR/CyaY superfamily)
VHGLERAGWASSEIIKMLGATVQRSDFRVMRNPRGCYAFADPLEDCRLPWENTAGGLMSTSNSTPKNIDEYIAASPAEVRPILEKIRLIIKNAAPGAHETISYKMPTFRLNGTLVYFAAFKKHVGFYPPVRGDAKLAQVLSAYAGEKGSLRFPLAQPIPYGLIKRIVKLRVRMNSSKVAKST